MEKRFAKYMEVNVITKRPDLAHYKSKFICRHEAFFPIALKTETAAEIATIAYFYVDFFEFH